MSKAKWLESFPGKNNKPEDFLKHCNRLDKNIILDNNGKCTAVKEPVCNGCSAFNLLHKRKRQK